MTDKCYPAAQALIDRAMKVDPALAADIRAFAQSREYGLVFEHNRPEAMRLYGKPIAVGDAAHVLPERGHAETDGNHVVWHVTAVHDGVADLVDADGNVRSNVSVDDVVAVAEYDQPIYAGLRETGRVERGGGELGDPGDKPYHVVINGENYHALEALQFCYAGKVDCIYIDPPYNTGARDWKYNNDYVDGNDAYRHSKWLAWMERRLKLAKMLLNPEDSVLIVTIDEKEYLRLGLLLEQTFPGETIQMVVDVISSHGSWRDNQFARCNEYIYYVFIGDANTCRISDDMLHDAKHNTVRWDGLVRRGATGKRSARPNLFYPIFFRKTDGKYAGVGKPLPLEQDRFENPVPDGCFAVYPIASNGDEGAWGASRETFLKKVAKGYIRFGKWIPGSEVRSVHQLQSGPIKDIESGKIPVLGHDDDGALILGNYDKTVQPMSVWFRSSHTAGDHGASMLRNVIPGHAFPYPKSLYAVEDALRFFVADKPNALVLDFFSGSGTTAHAVMRLNHQDGGRRRCISVTNNEVSVDEEKHLTSQSFRQGDPEWEALGICDYVTKPRIKAAITGITPDGDPIKGDYKFTDEFPISDGFDENAIFFDLTYEEPDLVELGGAFERIAPLLWMRAGCRGRIIGHETPSFDVADSYAVLFDYPHLNDLVSDLRGNDEVGTVFVVTDDEHRYAAARRALPGREVVRLYESYLRSFQIASEGAIS